MRKIILIFTLCFLIVIQGITQTIQKDTITIVESETLIQTDFIFVDNIEAYNEDTFVFYLTEWYCNDSTPIVDDIVIKDYLQYRIWGNGVRESRNIKIKYIPKKVIEKKVIIDGDDWFSVKIRNTTDNDDPTIRRSSIIIDTQHLSK